MPAENLSLDVKLLSECVWNIVLRLCTCALLQMTQINPVFCLKTWFKGLNPFIPETSHILYYLATSLHAHIVNGNKALAAATQGSYRTDSIHCSSCDGYKCIKDLTHKILLDIQILLFRATSMFPTKQHDMVLLTPAL